MKLFKAQADEKSARVSFGSQLRKARHSCGMTAKQLGKKTGLTGAQMSRVELGQCNISLGRMMDFALALGFNAFTVSQAGVNGPTLELGTKKHGCRTCFVETADVWPPYYREPTNES